MAQQQQRTNQTPSTHLLFDLDDDNDELDDLPPSYEDAIASSPAPPALRPASAPSVTPQVAATPASPQAPPTPPKDQQAPVPPPAASSGERRGQRQRGRQQQQQPAVVIAGSSFRGSSQAAVPGGLQPVRRRLHGSNLILGEHQDRPLYGVRLHMGWSGEPAVVLHGGSSGQGGSGAAIAGVDFDNWEGGMVVQLPAALHLGAYREVRVEALGGWQRAFRFAVDAGSNGQSRAEFLRMAPQLRPGHQVLDGNHDGWKLVRLVTAPPAGAPNAAAWAPGQFRTSDGSEVVAVWSDAVMSLTKRAKFALLGTGRSGLLGDRWAFVAVMSALGIWGKGTTRREPPPQRHVLALGAQSFCIA